MALRKTGHADAESTRVDNTGSRPDYLDKLGRKTKGIVFAFVVNHRLGRVAAQCKYIRDAALGITIQNRCNLILVVTHAGQMRHSRELCFLFDSHHEVMSAFAS